MTVKFEANMLADGEGVELLLFGAIGPTLMEEGIMASTVAAALSKAGNARRINLRLNSPGGSVWEGLAIRSLLAEHPAKVHASIEGLAASCASVIAMSADEITMHAGSRMMLHEARRQTIGDVREHKRALDMMQTINEGAAEIYAARSGQPIEKVREMMAAETWLSPEEAVKYGFADRVVAAKSGTPRMAFDLKSYGYKNVPASLAAEMRSDEEPPTQPPTQEKEPMSYARIAMALGLNAEGAEEAAVMAAITRLNNERQRAEMVLTELRHITKKQSADELVGAVRGLADVATQLSAAQSELEATKAKLEDQERQALIQQDATNPKGRKLTPAVAKLYEKKPVAELRAYLEVASILPGTVMSAGSSQPHTGSTAPAVDGGGDVVMQDGIALFRGKKWEDHNHAVLHDLYCTNKEAYDALKQNFEQRRRG